MMGGLPQLRASSLVLTVVVVVVVCYVNVLGTNADYPVYYDPFAPWTPNPYYPPTNSQIQRRSMKDCFSQAKMIKCFHKMRSQHVRESCPDFKTKDRALDMIDEDDCCPVCKPKCGLSYKTMKRTRPDCTWDANQMTYSKSEWLDTFFDDQLCPKCNFEKVQRVQNYQPPEQYCDLINLPPCGFGIPVPMTYFVGAGGSSDPVADGPAGEGILPSNVISAAYGINPNEQQAKGQGRKEVALQHRSGRSVCPPCRPFIQALCPPWILPICMLQLMMCPLGITPLFGASCCPSCYPSPIDVQPPSHCDRFMQMLCLARPLRICNANEEPAFDPILCCDTCVKNSTIIVPVPPSSPSSSTGVAPSSSTAAGSSAVSSSAIAGSSTADSSSAIANQTSPDSSSASANSTVSGTAISSSGTADSSSGPAIGACTWEQINACVPQTRKCLDNEWPYWSAQLCCMSCRRPESLCTPMEVARCNQLTYPCPENVTSFHADELCCKSCQDPKTLNENETLSINETAACPGGCNNNSACVQHNINGSICVGYQEMDMIIISPNNASFAYFKNVSADFLKLHFEEVIRRFCFVPQFRVKCPGYLDAILTMKMEASFIDEVNQTITFTIKFIRVDGSTFLGAMSEVVLPASQGVHLMSADVFSRPADDSYSHLSNAEFTERAASLMEEALNSPTAAGDNLEFTVRVRSLVQATPSAEEPTGGSSSDSAAIDAAIYGAACGGALLVLGVAGFVGYRVNRKKQRAKSELAVARMETEMAAARDDTAENQEEVAAAPSTVTAETPQYAFRASVAELSGKLGRIRMSRESLSPLPAPQSPRASPAVEASPRVSVANRSPAPPHLRQSVVAPQSPRKSTVDAASPRVSVANRPLALPQARQSVVAPQSPRKSTVDAASARVSVAPPRQQDA